MATRDELEVYLKQLAEDFKFLDSVVGATAKQEREISTALKQVTAEMKRTEAEIVRLEKEDYKEWLALRKAEEKASREAAKEAEKLAVALAKQRAAQLKAVGGAATDVATGRLGSLSIVGRVLQEVVNPFRMIGSLMGPFVQALNPSVMQLFSYSLKSLQATIGVALVPVLRVLSGAMRQMGGILLPLMQELGPVLGTITQALMGVFLPVLRVMVDVMRSFVPIINLAAGGAKILADMFEVLVAVLRPFILAFSNLVTGLPAVGQSIDIKSALESFRTAVQNVTKWLVQLIAYLAKSLGQLGFIGRMRANIEELLKPKQGVPPAPEGVRLAGFEDIAKSLAMGAFAAQAIGGEKEKSQTDFLRDILDTLRDVETNGKDMQTFLRETADYLLTEFENWLGQKLNELRPTYDATRDATQNAVRQVGGRTASGIFGAAEAAGRIIFGNMFGG